MGVILSKIEEIGSIRWCQLKVGRVAKAKRILALDETQVIVELENGQFTVVGRRHSPNGNWAVLGYGLDKFSSAVLDGMVRLGILTKPQVTAHKKAAAEGKEATERRYAKKRLVEACEALGIPCPEVSDA